MINHTGGEWPIIHALKATAGREKEGSRSSYYSQETGIMAYGIQ